MSVSLIPGKFVRTIWQDMMVEARCDTGKNAPAYALSISQSAVTGMTAREAHPANLGPAAALINRWLFLLPMEVVYLPPMMLTRCDMLILTSSGYDETVTLHTRTDLGPDLEGKNFHEVTLPWVQPKS